MAGAEERPSTTASPARSAATASRTRVLRTTWRAPVVLNLLRRRVPERGHAEPPCRRLGRLAPLRVRALRERPRNAEWTTITASVSGSGIASTSSVRKSTRSAQPARPSSELSVVHQPDGTPVATSSASRHARASSRVDSEKPATSQRASASATSSAALDERPGADRDRRLDRPSRPTGGRPRSPRTRRTPAAYRPHSGRRRRGSALPSAAISTVSPKDEAHEAVLVRGHAHGAREVDRHRQREPSL